MVEPRSGSPSGSYATFSSFAPSKGQNIASPEKRCPQLPQSFISRRMSTVRRTGPWDGGGAFTISFGHGAGAVLDEPGVVPALRAALPSPVARRARAGDAREPLGAVLGARAGRIEAGGGRVGAARFTHQPHGHGEKERRASHCLRA